MPLLGGEQGHFVLRPAAFGADGEGGFCTLVCGEYGGEGVFFFGLGEKDLVARGCLFECEFEGERVVDGGDIGAARLLRGFVRDATPTFNTLHGRLREMLLGASCEDGCDALDAEFGGLLDGPLVAIEFEDGEQEMEGQSGVGQHLFMQQKNNFRIGDGDDFGAVEVSAGDDVKDLAGLGAEDAREVLRLRAGERSVGCVVRVGYPAASCHRM